MFKSLARRDAGRRLVSAAAPPHCNDNRPNRRPAAALKRAPPQRLTCHWRTATAGGRLECHWGIEALDETSAEASGESCTTR